jgi:hypothetical protein
VDSSSSGEATSCVLTIRPQAQAGYSADQHDHCKNMSLMGSDTWSKVNALCKTSFTDLVGNMTIEETLQQKSYIMFMEQDDQSFNPMLFFSGSSFGFHVFDRTGLHCFVAQLNTTSSPKCILHILGCLFFGHPATVG